MDTSAITSRRAILGAAAGTLGALGLGSCSSGPDGEGTGGGSNSDAEVPAYVPFADVTPDLPGNELGVSPAFFGYPDPPVERPEFPLPETEPITALLYGGPPAVAPDDNAAYAVFREQAGNTVETTMTASQYRDKFQVTMASGDIPDIVQMQRVAQYPKLLEANFTDLSDVLGGDAVTRYPALANIPPATWKIPTVNGRLYGIAQPRPPAGRILSTRGDLLQAKGIDPSPELSSGEDFLDLLAELTEEGAQKFALGSDPMIWLLWGMLEMMEAPNQWAEQDGVWVSQLASEQMKEALSECAKIVKAGYLHPESFADPSKNGPWWTAGTTALYFQAFTGWGTWANRYPDWNVGYVRLPKWHGGGSTPVFKGMAGYGDFVAIAKQDSEERLHEILRVLDFVASPFGTQQFLDVNYGAPGFTYEMVDGNPQYIEGETGNAVAGWTYAGGNANAVLFAPGQDELTKAQHAYLSDVIPAGVDNAADGLYSETDVTKGASFAAKIADAQRAVMRGEASMADWDEVVQEWKSQVGDKVAAEYADAAANA